MCPRDTRRKYLSFPFGKISSTSHLTIRSWKKFRQVRGVWSIDYWRKWKRFLQDPNFQANSADYYTRRKKYKKFLVDGWYVAINLWWWKKLHSISFFQDSISHLSIEGKKTQEIFARCRIQCHKTLKAKNISKNAGKNGTCSPLKEWETWLFDECSR